MEVASRARSDKRPSHPTSAFLAESQDQDRSGVVEIAGKPAEEVLDLSIPPGPGGRGEEFIKRS
jgi:hypothetical protein